MAFLIGHGHADTQFIEIEPDHCSFFDLAEHLLSWSSASSAVTFRWLNEKIWPPPRGSV
jgi:hypothetical protein